MAAMRRLVLILLVALLPLQFAWAGAAAYCQHETGAAANHFGHHEHVHHGKAKTGNNTLLADQDCVLCHVIACPSALSVAQEVYAPDAWAYAYRPSLPSLSSARSAEPERPNWLRLA